MRDENTRATTLPDPVAGRDFPYMTTNLTRSPQPLPPGRFGAKPHRKRVRNMEK